MRAVLSTIIGSILLISGVYAQDAEEKSPPRGQSQAISQADPLSSKNVSDDVQQLRADVQRLKGLLNQMRTNLAFVQTTQSPLKHQFELEADAWQAIVEQMERRLKRLEDHTQRSREDSDQRH